MAEPRPQIPYFKEFLPTPVCIGLSLFFAMVFQFNGGVFLPAATQMSSALGCIQEDVTMAGYASFIGMTVIFPILFRLKSRFTTRSIFMTVCPVLILCNLITMHTENIFLMICVCFVSGFFRMWGTFECFSNTRLSITPSGNFSVFYPVIYIIVLESIQLSGLVTMHINDWANWQYMHWFVIAMLMVVWICVMCLTRTIRLGKKIPLYGIDWIGLLLWTAMLFAIVFICIYGDFYDWLDSVQIRSCIVIAVVSLLININRMPLQEIPRSVVPVLDALSVSHHLLRTAECVYDLHLTVRYAKRHFIELVCICRNPGRGRHCILPASSIKKGI